MSSRRRWPRTWDGRDRRPLPGREQPGGGPQIFRGPALEQRPRLLEAAVQRGLGRAYQPVAAQVLAQLPLLQQSTRPYGWRQWFDAMGVTAPHALSGPRYELFSMTAQAAIHGLGVALVPRLLIEPELARGELVDLFALRSLSRDGYSLSVQQASPLALDFAQWLQRECAALEAASANT